MLDKAGDKYKIVFEQTAGFDRAKGLSVTESALAGMATPPQVIVAANDDMALGALEAVKARNLKGIVIIGFDALPEALAKMRDGELTATIEQFPGKQSATGVDIARRLPQERQEARAADHAADARRDHQGQSQRRRAPQRGEVARRLVLSVGAPLSQRRVRNSRITRPKAADAERARPLDARKAQPAAPILRMTGVSKRFPGVRRWRTCISKSARPRFMRCSARTAPASRRC